MLKIKDNVDLCVLKHYYFYETEKHYMLLFAPSKYDKKRYGLKVNKETRMITPYNWGKHRDKNYEDECMIYFLQDYRFDTELIEKVEEK